MGCWNATCMVSRLPITCGTEVVGFILEPRNREPQFNGPIYPTDEYSVLPLPVYGCYNDYGAMENISDTQSTKIITELIGKGDIKSCIKHAERDEETNSPSKYRLAMIRRDVFDYMTSNLNLKNKIEKAVSECNALKSDYEDPDKLKLMTTSLVIETVLGREVSYVHRSDILKHLFQANRTVIADVIFIKHFTYMLRECRMSWHPPISGSQDTNWDDMLRMYAKFQSIVTNEMVERELL